MNETYLCPLCKVSFSTSQRLESHLKRKISCISTSKLPQKITIGHKKIILKPNIERCQYCEKTYASKDNLSKHIKLGRCRKFPKDEEIIINDNILKQTLTTDKILEKVNLLEKRLDEKDQQIEELKGKANITNNLQIVCLSNNDNYLDMLTQELGSFDRALDYIRDCALSSLKGDCKLVEKIYLSQDSQSNIQFTDRKRTYVEYFNEKKEKVKDTKELFGRKLANNLQNSYLKGVNHLITKNLENRGCPNKFLEDYDLQTWNQHIFDLSDLRYQKRIMNQLNILNKGETLD